MTNKFKMSDISPSILSRTKRIMADDGIGPLEAFKKANKEEEALSYELANQTTDRAKKAMKIMAENIYNKIRSGGN